MNTTTEICPQCAGSGEQQHPTDHMGTYETTGPCSACGGTGATASTVTIDLGDFRPLTAEERGVVNAAIWDSAERVSPPPSNRRNNVSEKKSPEGWKLVPTYPTKAMQDAWDSAPFSEDIDAEFRRAYQLMIDAAPASQQRALSDALATVKAKNAAAERGHKEAGVAYVTYDGAAADLNQLAAYVSKLERAILAAASGSKGGGE